MVRHIPQRVVKYEKDNPLCVDGIFEIVFDLIEGPVTRGLSEPLSTQVGFSALPDVRSMNLKKDSFIFTLPTGIYHTLFIQEEATAEERGAVQKSIAIRMDGYAFGLPAVLSEQIDTADKCTAEYATALLTSSVEIPSLEESLKILLARIPAGIQRILAKYKNAILENLLCCRSFLVVGRTPGEVSSVVCYLSCFCRVVYGGSVFPYRTSLLEKVSATRILIGVTNEFIYKKEEFDNAIDIEKETYFYKKRKCRDDLEKVFARMEEEFLRAPEQFSTEKWIEHMAGTGAAMETRRIFREFFSSPNFRAWLNSHGYTVEDISG